MTSPSITIGTRTIGAGHPCFVIAEAGINHNGDVNLAAQLVEAAASAGADAIKFQTHFPEYEMLKGGATAAYVGESLFDLLTRTALPKDAHVQMRDLAARKGIVFMSTPFSREAADYLDSIGVPAFKTGSGEMTNLPLQRHIARKGTVNACASFRQTEASMARPIVRCRARSRPGDGRSRIRMSRWKSRRHVENRANRQLLHPDLGRSAHRA